MRIPCVVVVLYIAAGLIACAEPIADSGPAARRGDRAAPELMVELAADPARGLTAEAALARLDGPAQVAANAQLRARAGHPSRARFLISTRLSDEVRARLRPDDPLEALHHWLVLEYPSLDATAEALRGLSSTGSPFLQAIQDAYGADLATLPNDSLYFYFINVGGSGQFGTSAVAAHAMMNVERAWDHVTGHAYLSPIDNGVQTNHPDLVDNLRLQFSRNGFDLTSNVEEPALFGASRGHGTHVAGIMAARGNNAIGTSGVCQACSLSVMRITSPDGFTCDSIVNGINDAIASGSQVLNLSFGVPRCVDATGQATGPVALAIAAAAARQITITGATGNTPDGVGQVQAPANHPSVLAIGAVDATGAVAAFSTSGPAVGDVDFVTPGDKIYSTFYVNGNWSPGFTGLPGTQCTSDQPFHGEYGYCSGTSMASPMMAGVVGLLRSANPLLSLAESRELLRASASQASNPTLQAGYGIPNAGASVANALYGPGGNQGTTPLFVLYSEAQTDHFYTTVPQMVSTAMCGTLRHGETGYQPAANSYGPWPFESDAVPGYQFPENCWAPGSFLPRAAVRLFTTNRRFGQDLKPLYRMSRRGAALPSGEVSHVYTTNGVPGDVGLAFFKGMDYVLDGIEGFVYPLSVVQPAGTVRLHRRYKAALDDYAIFPDIQLSYMQSLGYDQVRGADVIGYVCLQSLAAGTGVCRNVTKTAVAYVKATNAVETRFFGQSLALSADGATLAVASAGSVRVFGWTGAAWIQQATLFAGPGDPLGETVALSADGATLAIGARFEDSAATGINGNPGVGFANNAGAAYVFVRSGTTWTQQAYLKASNTGFADLFGNAVALSANGSTLAVAAYSESSAATGIDGNQADNSAPGAGAVYVFARSATTWTQQAYIKASNAAVVDSFGHSVALSADGATLAVGAITEDSAATGVGGNQADNTASNAGAAYVFTRSGTAWSQQAYLKASNTGASDQFGYSIALSADGATLAVGAYGEASAATGVGGNQADNAAPSAGAVYVFTRGGALWSQQAYVKASNPAVNDFFGYSVALSGDGASLAVGAYLEDSAASGIGGSQLDNTAPSAGAAYLFLRSGATWSQQSYLKASNTGVGDLFGSSLALSADGAALAIGAPDEDGAGTGIESDNSASDAGAVYVFR